MTVYWHWRMRAARSPAAAIGWVAVAGMTAVMLLAACGGKSGQQPTATPTPTASAAASASGTSTCMSQFTTWQAGAGADLPAFANAVMDFEGPAAGASFGMLPHAVVAQLKTAAASLLAAAKSGQANPPPSCVPGLRADYMAAMADFQKGAQGALDGVKAARSGDMQTATSDIKAAAKKIEAGSKALDAAVTDMENFAPSG